MRDNTALRGMALFFAFSLIQAICFPTVSLALTGGPGQPEYSSFEPVGTNQMVDLATGDFNYNIPLMSVPGPNGGYPINIAYHAGAGVEEEASWVGLGWNINAGVISRQMRGVPDDFQGDAIKREFTMKANVTVGVGFSPGDIKWFGGNTSFSASRSLYYNSYRGVGFSRGLNASIEADANGTSSFNVGLGLDFDSQTGLGFSGSISFGHKAAASARQLNGSIGVHSRQGLSSLNFGMSKTNQYLGQNVGMSKSAGVNFVNSTYVPTLNSPMLGTSTNFTFNYGSMSDGAKFGYQKYFDVSVFVQTNEVSEKVRSVEAYGYIYDEKSNNSENVVTDLNRSSDIRPSKMINNLPVPLHTNDIYSIKGQGTGGVFRPFRNDIGVYSDEAIYNESHSGGSGGGYGIQSTAVGTNNDMHFEGDFYYGQSNAREGRWKSDNYVNPVRENFSNRKRDLNNAAYSPVYFKSLGEMTVSEESVLDGAFRQRPIDFKMKLVNDGGSFKPWVSNPTDKISIKRELKRTARNQNIEYLTREEITSQTEYSARVDHFYPFNTIPTEENGNEIPYNKGASHHINKINVRQPDGALYEYALPAYNYKQKDVLFSMDSPINEPYGTDLFSDSKYEEYSEGSASLGNENGEDHLYSATTTPAFVHSYLLTAVYSDDYVDLTQNGPSDDDLGGFTKFNYSDNTLNQPYKWRIPYKGANLMKGEFSNKGDDKGSYFYGEKQDFYLHSVETKTHIAIFDLGDRQDGTAVSLEYNVSDANEGDVKKKKYIRKITLYSKKDLQENGQELAKPLKEVHFEYDYSLCKGVPNNTGTNYTNQDDTDHFPNANEGGKLTLKKVFFKYYGSSKGRLSPYQFTYEDAIEATIDNPNYSDDHPIDRWGQYQPNLEDESNQVENNKLNHENPYVNQRDTYADQRKLNAGAWCLKKIDLPSGGNIQVDYETDDYGYVQDKQAMQMFEVVGTSTENTFDYGEELSKDHTRIYFRLNKDLTNLPLGVTAEDEFNKYIKGLDNQWMKFKIFAKLKEFPSYNDGVAYDYVEGYAQLEDDLVNKSGWLNNDTGDIGYVTVKTVGYKKNTGSSYTSHPFQKAIWQKIELSRPDLLSVPITADAGFGIIPSVISLIEEAVSLIAGFYSRAALFGMGDQLVSSRPSYIRLNTPNFTKYGGGHRVKEVKIQDDWLESDEQATFGQQYEYKTLEGYSSGVADYEPQVGGEENPFKYPEFYNGNEKGIGLTEKTVMQERPFGEALYPSPRVVYGRVVVKNLENDEITKSQSGMNVTEFYTSKDFPVDYLKTSFNENNTVKHNIPAINIPYVGSVGISNNGFSQGYTFILNDMSGKVKSESVYSYKKINDQEDAYDVFSGLPVSKVEYFYKTLPHADNRLDNRVSVMNDLGDIEQRKIGETYDFYIEEREIKSESFNVDFNVNLDLMGLPTGQPVPYVPIPTLAPPMNVSESLFRSVVTNKVIYQSGVLDKVVSYKDGSSITTRDLIYDSQTGEPILRTTQNEWKKPVYNFQYPAHWAYDNMGPAYKNYKAEFNIWSAPSSQGSCGIVNESGVLYDLTNNPSLEKSITSLVANGDILVQRGGPGGGFDYSKKYYVTNAKIIDVSGQDQLRFSLIDEEGNAYVNGGTPDLFTFTGADYAKFKVLQSGRRNMQSVKNGSITSLHHPFVSEVDIDLLISKITLTTTLTFCQDFTNQIPAVWKCSYALGTSCGFSLRTETFTFNESQFYTILPNTLRYENGQLRVDMSHNITNEILVADVINNDEILASECFDVDPGKIIHADAVEFSDEWGAEYPYSDLGSPENEFGQLLSDVGVNPYRTGKENIWRVKRTNLFQTDRLQENLDGLGVEFKTKTNTDGQYVFEFYDWNEGAPNDKWDWVSEVTRYSPYGYAIEERGRSNINSLGEEANIYSSQMYGYDNSVVTASASNASYFEFGFDGFEEDNAIYSPKGHFNLTGASTVSNQVSHTGKKSLELNSGSAVSMILNNTGNSLIGIGGKKYNVSLWVYTKDNVESILTINDGTNNYAASSNNSIFQEVDGWTKLELSFVMPTGGSVNFKVAAQNGNSYMDDIRLSPFEGGLTTYVYDPITLWLMAELDGLNYATFYNYDEEGNLNQVRKETEKGIFTISSGRQNTKQQ